MGNRYVLGRMGTPYDLFLRSDLARIPRERYRLVCILGAPGMAAAELEAWRDGGATVLWIQPGMSEIRKPDGSQERHEGKARWTAAEFRAMAKAAGAHIYLEQDDVLYAGNGWLSVHTVAGGLRTIQLPFSAHVRDAFEGDVLSESTERLELQLPPSSTTLLRVFPN